jgi:hypothetical protein
LKLQIAILENLASALEQLSRKLESSKAVTETFSRDYLEPKHSGGLMPASSAETIPIVSSNYSGSVEAKLQVLAQAIPSMSDDLQALQRVLGTDVPSSLNKIRYVAEKILFRLCRQTQVSWGQGEPTLERMVGPLIASGCLPKNVAIHVRTIQSNSSPGSHYQEFELSTSHVEIASQALLELLGWFKTTPNELI